MDGNYGILRYTDFHLTKSSTAPFHCSIQGIPVRSTSSMYFTASGICACTPYQNNLETACSSVSRLFAFWVCTPNGTIAAIRMLPCFCGAQDPKAFLFGWFQYPLFFTLERFQCESVNKQVNNNSCKCTDGIAGKQHGKRWVHGPYKVSPKTTDTESTNSTDDHRTQLMPDRAQGECKHFHNTGDKIC